MTPQDGDKVAILVAGVVRSGTSALAGVLDEAGVRMIHSGTRDEFNPLGYFEHPAITFLCAALQAATGASPDRMDFQADIDFPEDDWTTFLEVDEIGERLAEVIEAEAAGAPLIGVKRETICRHFPLFETVLGRLGYSVRVLMPWRDPYEVAASIRKVWGLTVAHALRHRAFYVIDAERLTRHTPRAWVCYADLLGDQKDNVERALATIGVPLTVPAEGFTTAALRRSRPEPCDTVFPPLRSLVADVVEAIRHDSPPKTWDGLQARLADALGSSGR